MTSEASDSVSLSDRIPVPVANPQNKQAKSKQKKVSSYELGNSRRQVSFNTCFKLLLNDLFFYATSVNTGLFQPLSTDKANKSSSLPAPGHWVSLTPNFLSHFQFTLWIFPGIFFQTTEDLLLSPEKHSSATWSVQQPLVTYSYSN